MGKQDISTTNLRDHWSEVKGKAEFDPLVEGSRKFRRALKAIERRAAKKRKQGGGQ